MFGLGLQELLVLLVIALVILLECCRSAAAGKDSDFKRRRGDETGAAGKRKTLKTHRADICLTAPIEVSASSPFCSPNTGEI
jgi:hypothetical protein